MQATLLNEWQYSFLYYKSRVALRYLPRLIFMFSDLDTARL